MTERLLQFIWQFQYFNKRQLELVNGETLHIIHQGQYNWNQGPDFLEARIKIGHTEWAGNIELHVKTSDWDKHSHHLDANYRNVVLHVVWLHDAAANNSNIPVLCLQDKVSKFLLQQYESWMITRSFIPCENSIHKITDLVWLAWKERLLVERLRRKTEVIKNYLQQNNYHWEETFWWLLARNFGIKVNAEPFEALARSIPITILAKHKNQIHQLEALLLGQAGLLEKKFKGDYPRMLQKEYRFFQKKYKLRWITERVHFLRMRPINFPTIRLAQLAILIHNSSHLFSGIKETSSIPELTSLLTVTANDYWHYHYIFDESSSYNRKKLGKQMVNNIIINTIVPMLFSYGLIHNETGYKEKALKWLEEMSAENNQITNRFRRLKITNNNAFDSQSLIELKSQYCDLFRCLDCAVGNSLLKQTILTGESALASHGMTGE